MTKVDGKRKNLFHNSPAKKIKYSFEFLPLLLSYFLIT
jgi:hypothetical protein